MAGTGVLMQSHFLVQDDGSAPFLPNFTLFLFLNFTHFDVHLARSAKIGSREINCWSLTRN